MQCLFIFCEINTIIEDNVRPKGDLTGFKLYLCYTIPMRLHFSPSHFKNLAPLLVIQLFLLGGVIMYGLSVRQRTNTKAASVSCPPYSEDQGGWCDYRHTTNENDPNAPVLNPNYLDTYNDCWDKCVKLDTTQCNGVCHYGSATVCVQKDAWAQTTAQCSFICNWACCGGKPKIDACTGQVPVPTATKAPQSPTNPPQPTNPPYVPPTQAPYVPPPTSAPRITVVPPTQAPPPTVDPGSFGFGTYGTGGSGTGNPGANNAPMGDDAPAGGTDFFTGMNNFWNGIWSRVVFEAKLNAKRVSYAAGGFWYILTKPFEKP